MPTTITKKLDFVKQKKSFNKTPLNYIRCLFACSFLLFWTCAENTLSAEKDIERFGLSFSIKNEKTRELFYVIMESYAFLNGVKLIYNGESPRGLLAISSPDAIKDRKYNLEKMKFLSINDQKFISRVSVNSDRCSIQETVVPETSSSATLGHHVSRTLVVANESFLTTEEQLKCLFVGALTALGAPYEKLDEYISKTEKELAKKIVNGDF